MAPHGRAERLVALIRRSLYRARRHWPIIAVLTVFVGTAFIVPTLAPAWVADDWLYARAVESLLHHELRIPNLSWSCIRAERAHNNCQRRGSLDST